MLGLPLDNGYDVGRKPTLFELILSWIVGATASGMFHVESTGSLDEEKHQEKHLGLHIAMVMQLLDKSQEPDPLSQSDFDPMLPLGESPSPPRPPKACAEAPGLWYQPHRN